MKLQIYVTLFFQVTPNQFLEKKSDVTFLLGLQKILEFLFFGTLRNFWSPKVFFGTLKFCVHSEIWGNVKPLLFRNFCCSSTIQLEFIILNLFSKKIKPKTKDKNTKVVLACPWLKTSISIILRVPKKL